MSAQEAFCWGFAGSIAIEVVLFCNQVRGCRSGRLPSLYRRPAFLVGRVLLAVVAKGVLSTDRQ